MPIYTIREKLGHYNRLRGSVSHIDADLALLRSLDPKNELVLSPKKDINFANKVIETLLDLATHCDIVDYRRAAAKGNAKEAKWRLFVAKFNEGIDVLAERYADDVILATDEAIRDVFDILGLTPIISNLSLDNGLTILDLKGCILSDITIVAKYDEEKFDLEDFTDEHLAQSISYCIVASIKNRNERIDSSAASIQPIIEEPFVKEPIVEESTTDLESKTAELTEKESVLDEKEEDLEAKETLLNEKEDQLADKEAELEAKAKKKVEPKKKSTPK